MAHRPEEAEYEDSKREFRREKLDAILFAPVRKNRVEEWWNDARTMVAQIRAADRVMLKLADHESGRSRMLDLTFRGIEKNYKGAERAYKAYQLAWMLATAPETSAKEREIQKERWREEAGKLGARVHQMDSAWNAYRKACLEDLGLA